MKLVATTLIALVAAAVMAPSSASAQTADCASLIAHTESTRNIPRGLLMAIAVTESALNGRPNPYAMNIAGRSYFANGYQDMANVISANWSRGVQSIDVGCMQVNLKYHGMKFPRMTDLLDPNTNVQYGASYLISLATQAGSWKDAVMSYHNKKNPSRRAWYGCKVWNNYLRIAAAPSGYLNCGRAPGGSSTASRENTRPIMLAGYNGPSTGSPLSPASDVRQAQIGGTVVDVPVMRRPRGTMTLVGAGDNMPDVVSNDGRASAFQAVRPTDWSGRVRRIAQQDDVQKDEPRTSMGGTGGFGRVSSSN